MYEEFTGTIGQIERGEDCILTSSMLASYAARIPKLPPLDHFADLLTLCVDNGTGNPLVCLLQDMYVIVFPYPPGRGMRTKESS